MHNVLARRGVRQFVKFGIVGFSGLLVNLVTYTLLQKLTTLPFWLDFSIGFMLGGISNYTLNRIWTFRSQGHAGREGAQFLTVSFIAMLIGNGVFWICQGPLHFYHGHTVWFLATAAGMVWNFLANKYWTFRGH